MLAAIDDRLWSTDIIGVKRVEYSNDFCSLNLWNMEQDVGMIFVRSRDYHYTFLFLFVSFVIFLMDGRINHS